MISLGGMPVTDDLLAVPEFVHIDDLGRLS